MNTDPSETLYIEGVGTISPGSVLVRNHVYNKSVLDPRYNALRGCRILVTGILNDTIIHGQIMDMPENAENIKAKDRIIVFPSFFDPLYFRIE